MRIIGRLEWQDRIKTAASDAWQAVVTYSERLLRLSLTWAIAAVCLVVSVGIITAAVYMSVTLSSTDRLATSGHTRAEIFRSDALKTLIEEQTALNVVTAVGVSKVARFSRHDQRTLKSLVKQIDYNNRTLESALKMNDAADENVYEAENRFDTWQLWIQVAITIAAAFFGAVLGWIINEVLKMIRDQKQAQ